jgi:hypothetical protein
LQEVVTLSQQHMADDVIISFIRNSGKAYPLSGDDLIYLSNQGVSQNVILVLQQTSTPPPAPTAPPPDAAPAPAPVAAPAPAFGVQVSTPGVSVQMGVPGVAVDVNTPPPPPPAPEINFQYFHDQLAPWGTWIELPGYGPVWRPSEQVLAASPDWRPYYDNGQWVQTENGLYWQSDYTWGDIPFHYGRWILDVRYGWVWVPDYEWGPAWVFWRHDDADGAIGWAALPPGAVFVDGVFFFHGARVGLDFDFGLGEDCFVFVDGGHFHERFFRLRGREFRYHVGRDRLNGFYHHSVVHNEFRRDEHGRIVNDGIGHDRMAHMDPHVAHANFEERHPVGDRDHAAVDHREAGHPGAGHPEAGHPEAGHPEAGHPEAGHPEAGHPEAGHPEAGHPEARRPEAAERTAAPSKVFRPPTPAASTTRSPQSSGATRAPSGSQKR